MSQHLLIEVDLLIFNRGDDSSIASTILSSCGPFVTVRITQSSFSGSKRPTASTVVEVMMNLEKDGLGKVKTFDTTTVFYKCLLCNIVETSLENYKLSREDYRGKFTESRSETPFQGPV